MTKKQIAALVEKAHAQVEAERNVPLPLRKILAEAYGEETGRALAAEKRRWHHHKNGGGWVRDDAEVDPAAFVGPQAAVYGPETHVGRATRVEGRAVIGAGTTTAGKTVIDSSVVSGERPKTLGQGKGFKKVHVIDSEISYSTSAASTVRESHISQASIEQSFVEQSEVSGPNRSSVILSDVQGAKIYDSVVAESNVAQGAKIDDALVVETDVAPGLCIAHVEMNKGHVQRPQLPDYDAYAAMERSGKVKPLRHFGREQTR